MLHHVERPDVLEVVAGERIGAALQVPYQVGLHARPQVDVVAVRPLLQAAAEVQATGDGLQVIHRTHLGRRKPPRVIRSCSSSPVAAVTRLKRSTPAVVPMGRRAISPAWTAIRSTTASPSQRFQERARFTVTA